jgi:hypothetical protein
MGAPTLPRIPVDDESLQLTIAAPLEAHDTLVAIADLSIDVGRSQIREGCYCRLGNRGEEIVRVGKLRKEVEVHLRESMDAAVSLLHMSDHQAEELDLMPGACLIVGHEILRFRSVRGHHAAGQTLVVARAQCGSKAQAHAHSSKVRRLAYLEVERGTCGTRKLQHKVCTPCVCVCVVCVCARCVSVFVCASEVVCLVVCVLN